jgi:hypothetical protein
MMPYAAYRRIYESLSAFGRPNRTRGDRHASFAAGPRMRALPREDAQVSRPWFGQSRSYSPIELDHGGLVLLRSDQELLADESVAGMATAIESLARSEWEVAVAMDHRAHARWRCPRATAFAN